MSITPELSRRIEKCRIALIGAGGIGCEVLKNLTMSGFKNVDAVDLDTIDVSNLNRQFLFNKTHVGKSKAKTAVEVAKSEYSASSDGLSLNGFHRSVFESDFSVDFFKQYDIVINALDNRAARSHVNRICIAADVPLIESGTAGYTGQSRLIKSGLTSCYECDGIQKEGKTYATCTIRNTPSQPIHCIVWAKHLFNQLFGEDDPDNDVSPNVNSYDPALLFHKLYNLDIQYLLSMENLWKNREKPEPLDYLDLISDRDNSEQPSCSKISSNGSESHKLELQRLWSLKECVDKFSKSVHELHQRMLSSKSFQQWDKDDEMALNFVVAASNLRSRCFNIERKSPFDVKSLAGNIVPAISSTNSIIGGLIVLQAIRLLKSMPAKQEYENKTPQERNELLKGVGKVSYLNYTSLARPDLIASFDCSPPVPDCFTCSSEKTPEVEIHLSMKETTLSDLVDKIIIGTFHFVCPDLSLDDGSGTIIWTIDEDEDDDATNSLIKKKVLVDLPHIKPPKTRLMITDLIQDKRLIFSVVDEKLDEESHKNFFYAKLNGKELSV